MKILVIGDTHGKLNKVRDIYGKLRDIDLIIHTGDYMRDGLDFADEVHLPVISVEGNCDGSRSRDDFEIVETECGNILVTHGHMYGVDYDLSRLLYKAQEEDCIAAVFGHTHCALIDEADGIHFVNPGSLTQPRDGSDGTYAIIRTDEDSFNASVVYYSTVMGTGKKGSRTGYIRSLIQYSDRF
ncbi:MAG: metallophosphoesterase [Firmicutes bacterium]|nr:metallophosphoesterase [Bacillota bacterium]